MKYEWIKAYFGRVRRVRVLVRRTSHSHVWAWTCHRLVSLRVTFRSTLLVLIVTSWYGLGTSLGYWSGITQLFFILIVVCIGFADEAASLFFIEYWTIANYYRRHSRPRPLTPPVSTTWTNRAERFFRRLTQTWQAERLGTFRLAVFPPFLPPILIFTVHVFLQHIRSIPFHVIPLNNNFTNFTCTESRVVGTFVTLSISSQLAVLDRQSRASMKTRSTRCGRVEWGPQYEITRYEE